MCRVGNLFTCGLKDLLGVTARATSKPEMFESLEHLDLLGERKGSVLPRLPFLNARNAPPNKKLTR